MIALSLLLYLIYCFPLGYFWGFHWNSWWQCDFTTQIIWWPSAGALLICSLWLNTVLLSVFHSFFSKLYLCRFWRRIFQWMMFTSQKMLSQLQFELYSLFTMLGWVFWVVYAWLFVGVLYHIVGCWVAVIDSIVLCGYLYGMVINI